MRRGREVLQLLAEGKTASEVAEVLNIKTRTVYFHKYEMMKLLGAKSNAELMRLALRLRSARKNMSEMAKITGQCILTRGIVNCSMRRG